ncbi:MAG: hypothetical protein ACKO5F_07475 [Synechococcus sp.]
MDYRQDRLYGSFLHRELAVSWLALANLLGGRHRWDLRQGRFTVLEFGCGFGQNLLFNAAAHPEAQFPASISTPAMWPRPRHGRATSASPT